MALFPMISVTLTPNTSEWISELYQDNDRSGFQNLGSGDNVRTYTTNANFSVNAQGGDDTIKLLGTGDDVVHAGSGDDYVLAGAGDDEIYGGSGNDTLIGFDGNDEIWGGSGNDNIEGGIGVDFLYGGTGKDNLTGGANADFLDGGSGNDELLGDNSSDTVGNDTLSGGDGNDTIEGSGGADRAFGGAGADTFVFRHQNDFGGHPDYIGDFSHAEGDLIDLSAIDARTGGTANDTFSFVNGPSTAAGTIWVGALSDNGDQTIFINRDGGAADHMVFVNVADIGTSLQASDFIL